MAIIITEAATNIGKHAKSGHIYLRPISAGDKHGIEVIAVDAGPGMHNIAFNFADGNSSTGTSGTGLGAIKRLAHFIDLYSQQDKGTVLLMILWDDPKIVSESFWEVGNMCLPIPSEDICGDTWNVIGSKAYLSILVADGLGHGLGAADASSLALKALEKDSELPIKVMQNSHLLMRDSLGAAVGIARIDVDANELRYCGVGNIAGCIYTHENRQHLISHNGVVGRYQ